MSLSRLPLFTCAVAPPSPRVWVDPDAYVYNHPHQQVAAELGRKDAYMQILAQVGGVDSIIHHGAPVRGPRSRCPRARLTV
jgi:hypothetical protein